MVGLVGSCFLYFVDIPILYASLLYASNLGTTGHALTYPKRTNRDSAMLLLNKFLSLHSRPMFSLLFSPLVRNTDLAIFPQLLWVIWSPASSADNLAIHLTLHRHLDILQHIQFGICGHRRHSQSRLYSVLSRLFMYVANNSRKIGIHSEGGQNGTVCKLLMRSSTKKGFRRQYECPLHRMEYLLQADLVRP